MRTWTARLVMFHFVCLGWLFFRADSMPQAVGMLSQMASDLSVTPFAVSTLSLIAFFAGPVVLYELWLERRGDLFHLLKVHWLPRGLAYSYFVLMLILFLPPVKHEFIYFQF